MWSHTPLLQLLTTFTARTTPSENGDANEEKSQRSSCTLAKLAEERAAEDYTRTNKQWHVPSKDNHFYPIIMDIDEDNEESGESKPFRRGKFCNSKNANSAKIPTIIRTTPLASLTELNPSREIGSAMPQLPLGWPLTVPWATHHQKSRKNYIRLLRVWNVRNDNYYDIDSLYYYKDASKEGKGTTAAMVVNPPNQWLVEWTEWNWKFSSGCKYWRWPCK